jgi:uncharacterized protein (TIGR02444 family)
VTDGGDLWTFATRLYARPGIEAACLGLQERLGLDVNILLLACWLGSRGVFLGEERPQSLAAAVAPLRTEVTEPLRAIRQRMKNPALPPPFAGPLEELRERVKELELEGERLELLVLEARTRDLPAAAPRGRTTIRANLALFADPDHDPDVAALLAAATG